MWPPGGGATHKAEARRAVDARVRGLPWRYQHVHGFAHGDDPVCAGASGFWLRAATVALRRGISISLQVGWRLAFKASASRAEVGDHLCARLSAPRSPAPRTRWQPSDSFLRSCRDFLRLFFTAPRILR